jgi:endoglucanase
MGRYPLATSIAVIKPILMIIFSVGICLNAQGILALEPSITNTAKSIVANQLGFVPKQTKIAVVPNVSGSDFKLINTNDKKVVYFGKLSPAKNWDEAGELVKIADLSGFIYSGDFALTVNGVDSPIPITIKDDVYRDPLAASIKYYYFNRSGAALEEAYAGVFHRPASHPDTIVYVHQSAASSERPAGSVIASTKGWFDAGDYNKYIVNSNITVYTLLRALENNPDMFLNLNLNIPESNNRLPDLLDEILWNLDWMETMQESDGGLYHKLTTKDFEGKKMPHEEYQARFVLQKTTAATLGYAATMARASKVISNYENQLPGRAERYKQSALKAWQWALKNPDILFEQPAGFKTGTYASAPGDLKDELAWAGAELYALTGKKSFLSEIEIPENFRPLEWRNLETLALLSIANVEKAPKILMADVLSKLQIGADAWLDQMDQSGYGVALSDDDFRWGSNGIAVNKALVLFEVNKLLSNPRYLRAAEGLVDYVLGRNPKNISYVTGYGRNSPTAPHHRISAADRVNEPIPGMLVGGPHTGNQDKDECSRAKASYSIANPAKAYLDHWCSYATNEVAINWNAGLVFVLAEMNAPR